MGKVARRVFTDNGTFVVPAGVTQVKVTSAPIGANGLFSSSSGGSNQTTAQFIDNNQNMWAMGYNGSGLLGANISSATTSVSSPVAVSGSIKWLKFVPALVTTVGGGGDLSMYAIDTAGQLWSWGLNAWGQLGDGSITAKSSPVAVITTAGTTFKQVIPISWNSSPNLGTAVVALDGQGKAWSWGRQPSGFVSGNGTTGDATSSPVAVVGSHVFSKLFVTLPVVSGDSAQGCVWGLDTAGALWGWATNINGALGTGTTPGVGGGVNLSSPTLILGATSYATVFTQTTGNVAAIANFFLDTSSNMWSSGSNAAGQLGIGISPGVTAAISSPALVVGNVKWQSMVKLFSTTGTVSFNTWCGLDKSGNAYSWGSNTSGALAAGVPAATTAARSSPVLIVGTAKYSKLFSICNTSGNQSFFGIDTVGQLWSWGDNADGLLAVGDLVNRSSPTMIAFPAGFGRIVNLQNNKKTLIATDDQGHVYTWGFNVNGQTGVGTAGTATPQLSSPVQIVGGRLYTQILTDEGGGCVFGACTDGNVYGWGLNALGTLGLADNNPRSSPTIVVENKNYAFAQPQTINTLPVTPGTSIPVFVRGSNIAFGNTQVGFLGDSLVVEFEQ